MAPFAESPLIADVTRWSSGLSLESIPEDVRHHAKRIVLDTLGVTAAGSSRPEVRSLTGQLSILGEGRSTLVGSAQRGSVTAAALINGTAAISMELDEGNQFATNHPAAHILPGLLAVCEERGIAGGDLLAGFIAGYEVVVRVGQVVRLRPTVHPFGTFTIAGTAAAVCRALQLDSTTTARAVENALALMVTTAQNAANSGSTMRNVYTGMTNAGGLTAVAAATAGVVTDRIVLDDVLGKVLGTSVHLDERPDLTTWFISQNYFKEFACSRWNHAPIEAALQVRDQVTPDRIGEIMVETYDPAIRLDGRAPANWFAAKHSIPFNVSAALLLGRCDAGVYTDEIVHSPQMRSLCSRVQVIEDPSMTAQLPHVRAARVTIRLVDGSEVIGFEDRPRGGVDNPFPDGWLEHKFHDLATPILGEQAAHAVQSGCDRLEHLVNLDELTAHLRTAS